jgi:error-prone DNA polymerase
MVHPYLRRRAGEEEVDYLHPSLKPLLERTLGVPLFQEQGMQVAITAAGFTPAEADELRRSMGHKRSRERMAALHDRLISGMRRNGIADDAAARIVGQLSGFADYGFPESHAASFALIVYASAYLKCHYAPEFTAALLNAQPMGFYAPGTIVQDAQRHGVKVLPVDVALSEVDTTLEWIDGSAEPAMRLGLRLVRGLGTTVREELEAVLASGGRFGERPRRAIGARQACAAASRRSRCARLTRSRRAGGTPAPRRRVAAARGGARRCGSIGAVACHVRRPVADPRHDGGRADDSRLSDDGAVADRPSDAARARRARA